MNKQHLLGVDIGGTKCAVTYGCGTDGHLDILDKERFATTTCQETVENLIQLSTTSTLDARTLLQRHLTELQNALPD